MYSYTYTPSSFTGKKEILDEIECHTRTPPPLPLSPSYINKNREDNSFAGEQRAQKSGQQLCVEDGDATELLRAKNDGTINSP